MIERNRVVIVGAGHNGLVCAAYLAKAGREVAVLEAADQVGGLAAMREFAPGFRASCAHLLYLLDSGIAKELDLASYGLVMSEDGIDTVALDPEGAHLTISAGGIEGSSLPEADRQAWAEYRRMMSKFAAFVGKLHNRVPPRIRQKREDLFGLGKMALELRRMGRDDMREFLRIAGINIHDVLEEHFEDELLKGALSLDAVLGSFSGPRSNNTVFTALHRMSGGGVSIPAGGMGAVSDALAEAARNAGAEIRTGCKVRRILSDGLEVRGVELENGEEIPATTVVSNADPKTTMLGLLGARHLETGFASRFDNVRTNGNAAKLHLALDGLPEFTGLERERLGQRLLIAPGPGYVDRAFNHCKYGEFSPRPVMEIILPTLHDPSLAPEGNHLLSAIVQYAPYRLKGGWESGKAAFLATALDTLETYAPGIREQVIGGELLTPSDLEAEYGVSGGHWHHGELSLDQFMMLRPVPKAAQYRMPVEGLWLCGAGCHPGGGVMGSAGRNAAQALLAGGES